MSKELSSGKFDGAALTSRLIDKGGDREEA